MTKKQKLAAFVVGLALLALAALFTIGIIQGILDFGVQSTGKGSFIRNAGSLIFSVYGFSSLFIPAFLILAGYFCFDADWSWQRAFVLGVSVLPFFTLVGAEKLCRHVVTVDVNPVAAIKISVYVMMAVLLAITEYLLASLLGGAVKKAVDAKKERNAKNHEDKKQIVSGTEIAYAQAVKSEEPADVVEAENSSEPEGNVSVEEKVFAEDRGEELSLTEKFALKIEAEERAQKELEEQEAKKNKPGLLAKIMAKFQNKNDEDDVEKSEVKEMPVEENAEEESAPTANQIATDFEPIAVSTESKPKRKRNNFWSLDDEGNVISKDKTSPVEDSDSVEEEAFVETEFESEKPAAEEVKENFKSQDEKTVKEILYGNFQESGNDDVIAEFESENKKIMKDDVLEDEYSGKIFCAPSLEDDEGNEEEDDGYISDSFYTDQEPTIPDVGDVFAQMDEDVESGEEEIESEYESEYETESEPEPETNDFDDDMPLSGATAVVTDANGVTKPIELRPKKSHGPYKISTDLLTEYEQNPYWEIDEATKLSSADLKETLKEFNIDADVIAIRKGPVVTMFEILPAPGVKLSKIQALQDNIALRLAATSVRIVAPIPGKQAVGIEVPNKSRAIVSFRECIEQNRSDWNKMAVPVVLGKDIEGETKIMDLVKTPHLLIAGSTGAGKSVCVNSMILSILYKRSPAEVKMILIDPKIVELSLYNGIGHLLTPVITEAKMAMQALQYCLCEMERRYAILKDLGCRDISSYNQKIKEQHIATEKLPYIIVVIDEFADLMATTGKQLEQSVARLCAKARAIGIHLVLATQRPSVDVITGLIKANIPSRIAFMVSSKMDSRIIIDQMGADKLLGKGDMLYASATDPFPVRIQGAFVSDQEVENVVNAVKDCWGEPDYIDDEIFIDDEEEEDGQLTFFSESGDDPLYDKALDIVVQTGRASASYIQRKLKIGYNRAARLVEEMEERGIVGPANGSKPREIIHMP